MRRAFALRTVALCSLALLGSHCTRATDEPGTEPPMVDIVFDRAGFESAQATRAEGLARLEASGSVELRTDDGEKRTFDDAQVILWRDQARTALRVTKLGERLLWVGGDGERWWVFQLAQDPVSLRIAPVGRSLDGVGVGQAALLGPVGLLELAGILPVTLVDDSARRRADGTLDIEVAASEGAPWDRLRWTIDPSTRLPSRIVAIDAYGEPLATATLERYVTVRRPGVSPLEYARMPEIIRLATPDENVRIDLFFADPVAQSDRLRDRLFELDRLVRTFRPTQVEEVPR